VRWSWTRRARPRGGQPDYQPSEDRLPGGGILLPINQRRPGYPENLTVEFSDAVLDTSVNIFPDRARPRSSACSPNTAQGDVPMDFSFRDTDGDTTLEPDQRADRHRDVPPLRAHDAKGHVEAGDRHARNAARSGGRASGCTSDAYSADDVFLFTSSGERSTRTRPCVSTPMHPTSCRIPTSRPRARARAFRRVRTRRVGASNSAGCRAR